MTPQADNTQICHSPIKIEDYKVVYDVMSDTHKEHQSSHRHRYFAIYWIHDGKGSDVIDFQEYELRPDRIFFIRPEQVHFPHWHSQVRYSALHFTKDFMLPFLDNDELEMMVYKDLTEAECRRIKTLFVQLNEESQSGLPYSNTIIQSQINTLLLELKRICLAISSTGSLPETLSKYKTLVEKYYHTHHQVQTYADMLHITPNYLNVLAKKHFGKSALEIINDRITLEIKRQLILSDTEISEIAYRLNFNELSYFSRFFKRITGVTPNEFRTTMNKMYQR